MGLIERERGRAQKRFTNVKQGQRDRKGHIGRQRTEITVQHDHQTETMT